MDGAVQGRQCHYHVPVNIKDTQTGNMAAVNELVALAKSKDPFRVVTVAFGVKPDTCRSTDSPKRAAAAAAGETNVLT